MHISGRSRPVASVGVCDFAGDWAVEELVAAAQHPEITTIMLVLKFWIEWEV
jgi:hypothetical protein